jgi:phenylpropionate dioxygenase-like ring-hydroxylating dioxygenase large terminal subunit
MAVHAGETGDVLPESGPVRRTPVTIPAYRYTSPDFFAREMEQLWPSVWQLACTVDHVANPGDWFEYRIGPYSVLIVRGDDGELRAFQNVCLHRGSELCSGSGSGLVEIRCPFHRWTWGLDGRLREVPSRREFGVLNDDYPLIGVQVGSWGPLVFVNLDRNAAPLADFLAPVPAESDWARLGDFRGRALISIPAACNWKTLIEGFSETYHVQGIHREMLGMCDDVNGPQVVWPRHGRLEQSYGLPSPRQGRPSTDAEVFASFVEVMGTRIGIDDEHTPMPEIPPGSSLREMLAAMVRDVNRAKGLDLTPFSDHQVLDMQQYNLFPNITVLVFADLLSVVRARPGTTVEEAFMDVFAFDRVPAGDASPRTRPFDALLPPDSQLPTGLVLNQDVANFARTQRGLRQPGLTHLTVSPTEECRVVNLHRTLEEYLGIVPSEMGGLDSD